MGGMVNLPVFFNGFSVALQIVAMFLAIRLIIKTKENVIGLSIILMATLMAIRRGIVLYRVITDRSVVSDIYSNLSGIFISIFLIIGILYGTKLIVELKESILRVKVLQGFFPVCSNCMKIRDDLKSSNRIDAYSKLYSDEDFTRTLCPDCLNKYYSGFMRIK
jgi:hypothetical protein